MTAAAIEARATPARRLQAMNVIACALSGSVDTHDVVEQAVCSLLDVTGLNSGCVYLHDDERGLLVSCAPIGFRFDLGEIATHDPQSGSFPSRAFRSVNPITFDVRDEEVGYGSITEVERQAIIPQGVKTAIASRIESSSKNYGVIVLCSADRPRDFGQDDVDFTRIVAGQIGVALERAQLYDDLKSRALEATTFYEIGRALGSTVQADAVLPRVLELAADRFGFARCEIELSEPIPAGSRLSTPPPRDSATERIFIPLDVAGLELGRLVVHLHGPPDQHTQRRVNTLGDLISVAIWNGRLYADSKRLGVIEERNRLARELHDGLTQRFYAIQVQLLAAERSLGGLGHAAQTQLRIASEYARQGLDEARRSVRDLRDANVAEQSLVAALRNHAARLETESGVECRVITRGVESGVDIEVKTALLRSIQELMHNVEKHAAASTVTIALAFAEDGITATVADNGLGFEMSPANSNANGGFGLVGITERMALVGGTLAMRSSPGRGTVARLEIRPTG